MKKYSVHLVGITPLIMHSPNLCNPFYNRYKHFKELTSLKGKTDATFLELAEIEFKSGLYYDEEIGIHMPIKCLRGSIWAAARKSKKGKQVKAILFEDAIGTPLIEAKGKSPNDLFLFRDKNDSNPYMFVEQLRVQRNMVTRTRPMFHKWSLKFNLYNDESLLQESDMISFFETSGKEYGLCELRPERGTGNFGKYSVESFKAM